MLSQYINAAMSKAVYEKLEDGSYSGVIPECPGTIAFAKTLFECEKELQSVLEGWIIFKIRHGDELPIIDGVDLNKGIPDIHKATARG